jgi:KDO2-lipid IV(A) lauroyltransferase
MMNQSRPLTRSEWHLFRILMGVFYVIGRIPRVVSRKIGNLLGDAGYWLDRRHREIALDNISLALGNELDRAEQASLARAVYRNLGQIIFEVGWSVTAELESLYDHVTIEGLENYLAAFKKGKGVLVITAHIGNWELASVVAKKAGMPIHVVYRPLDFRPLDLFFKATRSRFGATLIPSRHALLKILKALKKGEAVAMLMDQNVDYYDGVWVDFFGHPACTSKAMAVIAMKTGAPVLPVFLYRESAGFRAIFGPMLPPANTGDRTKDIEANTAQYTKVIEAGIRKKPDQWFWVHQRWKTKTYCPWPKEQ